jgi:hypothetical protein
MPDESFCSGKRLFRIFPGTRDLCTAHPDDMTIIQVLAFEYRHWLLHSPKKIKNSTSDGQYSIKHSAVSKCNIILVTFNGEKRALEKLT